MNKLFVKERIDYTGAELRSHYILENFDMYGDSIVSFVGRAVVELENMVDIEDVKRQEHIYSPNMLHFIIEFFGSNLANTVCLQRLLVSIARGILDEHFNARLTRSGDDLFFEDKKLSVCIATASPVSTLIHFGLNIETEGVPVKAIGLRELNVEPEKFAELVMNAFEEEIEDMRVAVCKVRPVF